ncbi:SCO family protein [Pseudogracilibacillus auburnensis]|uniref:Protein SCO1/2 n=1 Tax=Pseudogracilibacillus auburnensis TaxID=1494959 RepID=A0A2V3WBF3_9BACI|nr:SCO family protein [Pseudogracilibacillus auburnensis]MBO1001583.1 SCO family protein [Pseudogracilibacillus auburnensis]PXW89495.1 protein SCO1/2 [Pseudogracilibacillus auburnensis]
MKKLIQCTMIFTLLILAACGGNKVETTMSEEVMDFEATTQAGDTLTRDDLKGEYWVADFIFTNCTTVCLPMTRNMKILQDKMQEAGIENVQLVSFSVDPDRDTPEVLTEYANEYGADLENWTFLTGYDFDSIKELSIKSFKSLVAEPPEGDDQVMHGTSFFLVNPEGEVIKNYTGIEMDAMDEIVSDLKNLQ